MSSAEAPKVPVYSSNDLKSTTDDALAPHLTTLPQPYRFTQDNTMLNVRLLLGYSAVAIAGFTFYADRMLKWEATRSPWILAAVASYFILNSLLTYWIWAVEAGEVFRGKRKSGETIVIRSSVKKHSPLYKLKVQYTSPAGKVIQEKEIETSFTKWFAADGTFHIQPLRDWLASEIEVLRLAANEIQKKTGGVASHVAVQEADHGEGGKGGQKRK
ncbi:putative signal peptidase complex component [Aspergillus japonicus CBS 114.51]|uniref:Signal peptidase complex subunit 2 n=2 Tax=Aspergillus TaxID=5052 RepID=A0A2V5HAQ6_ASPV1|nr:putative signal peptidase complex component [Aspergillus japonicus CBS 114.51]PYI18854.1 putative signal peptidase complex component [Aspergillus violaceofuscus CBS 115571]RAH81092.1 putative signal peptidase complex component [Aspergillus japonicus CBS 114.51]